MTFYTQETFFTQEISMIDDACQMMRAPHAPRQSGSRANGLSAIPGLSFQSTVAPPNISTLEEETLPMHGPCPMQNIFPLQPHYQEELDFQGDFHPPYISPWEPVDVPFFKNEERWVKTQIDMLMNKLTREGPAVLWLMAEVEEHQRLIGCLPKISWGGHNGANRLGLLPYPVVDKLLSKFMGIIGYDIHLETALFQSFLNSHLAPAFQIFREMTRLFQPERLGEWLERSKIFGDEMMMMTQSQNVDRLFFEEDFRLVVGKQKLQNYEIMVPYFYNIEGEQLQKDWIELDFNGKLRQVLYQLNELNVQLPSVFRGLCFTGEN